MKRTIVCHCEDISLAELYSAAEQGYGDIESLKRFTGIGTGKCQGKCCLVQAMLALDGPRGRRALRVGADAGPGVLLANRGAGASEAYRDEERPGTSDPQGGAPADQQADRPPGLPTMRQPVLPLEIGEIAAGHGPSGDPTSEHGDTHRLDDDGVRRRTDPAASETRTGEDES